ncbi:hypothetical protein L3V86_08400 [Thiotrichales bacterium 19S11-10]|nr:hypothetical protein [Thiotrichales bacterium 19S11-10]
MKVNFKDKYDGFKKVERKLSIYVFCAFCVALLISLSISVFGLFKGIVVCLFLLSFIAIFFGFFIKNKGSNHD